jgi:formate hydrogenlyase subunit 4
MVNMFFVGVPMNDFAMKQLAIFLVVYIVDNQFPLYRIEHAVRVLWVYPIGWLFLQLIFRWYKGGA